MADFKYKMDWVPEAKKLREQVSQRGKESMGIASKPKDEQPAMDQDFYESMYGAILQYFDKAEDADKVLSSKKPDRDSIREMTLGEFDELTLRSSEEAALQRMESRTTQSLVEGGGEAFRTKLPEGESLRPKLRDDTAKDEQEPTPVTVEPSGNGLMSPRLDTKGETPPKQYTDSMFKREGNTVTPDINVVKEFAKETFDNPVAAAAFVATVEAESGTNIVETGYSKSRALEVFVERNRKSDGTLSPAMARRKARLEALPDDASGDAIFDIVYDRASMGNTEPGDGSRYKGRGLIMLTGKDNYRKYGEAIGVDLVENPELLETDMDVMLRVTMAYLNDKGFETNDLTQSKLASMIGHSDDASATEARRRWNKAKQAYRDMYGKDMPSNGNTKAAPTESLRPKLRPEEEE